MKYKLRFDAAKDKDAKLVVAKQWAREIIIDSGMPMVKPPTDKQIEDAYQELMLGDKVKNISGRQD